MVKLLGSVCVFGGIAWGWYLRRAARRGERETLRRLLAALRQMAEEVRLARTPLPPLLARLGAEEDAAGSFFRRTAQALQAGTPLPQAWGQALEALPVSAAVRAALAELGMGLRGDEETACKAIFLAIDRLEACLAELERRRPEEEKRSAALSFSAAALLVILWI